jgi:hypothetical protein
VQRADSLGPAPAGSTKRLNQGALGLPDYKPKEIQREAITAKPTGGSAACCSDPRGGWLVEPGDRSIAASAHDSLHEAKLAVHALAASHPGWKVMVHEWTRPAPGTGPRR